ncbi:serine hydrolase [Candidatus Parcubacteria bacterium]|nr:serine hydrolase [Candidatus Parcubacteria bacterium]
MPEQKLIQGYEIRFLASLFVVLTLMMIISYVLGARVERGDASKPTQVVASPVFNEDLVNQLQAKSVYVYDVRNQSVLFAKNENTRLPLASLTKLMTALVASERSPSYGTVTITKEALAAEGDSGLLAGEKWSLKNLLDFSLTTSSNDGMRAVALTFGAIHDSTATPDEIIGNFVGLMNEKARELDLKNTYFWNETGLDESEQKGGAYGSAKDVATLLEYILRKEPEMLETTRQSMSDVVSLDGLIHKAKNTNLLAGAIPGLMGSKTGFTNTAGGNLAIAFDPELGRPFIIVVMGSTENGRFEDVGLLTNAVLKQIKEN